MSAQEIIRLGEEITPYKIYVPTWVWILASIILVLGAVFVWILWGGLSYKSEKISVVLFIFMLLAPLVAFLESKPNEEYIEWKKLAYEYIQSLPQERHEIVYVKVDPEIEAEVRGGFLFGNGTISTDTDKLTPVTVAYKVRDEVILDTFWAKTNMKLGEKDTPYLTYKNLEQDLGEDVKAGWYDTTIHLPKGYTFTEIK